MNEAERILVRRLAIVGDLHGQFSGEDVYYFNASPYDLLLFVGDLGSGTRKDGLSVIRRIAKLKKPTFILPGNNDAEHYPDLAAELAYQAGRLEILQALGKARTSWVIPVGYSCHELVTPLGNVSLIVGRPLAQGGSQISFPDTLERLHGVRTHDASVRRYRELVDHAESETLVFLAHNGPSGLGEGEDALWGRDFPAPPGEEARWPRDFGDEDLGEAIAYARSRGKKVLAVIAGHMHRRRSSSRPLFQEVAGTIFVNAAMVPRIRAEESGPLSHHAEVRFDPAGLEVVEHWVAPASQPIGGGGGSDLRPPTKS